ncbi:MAG TPA: YicC/YloC family endoribonuclease [Anaeromyxobacteraceae bacterium]|nr:YicC/YloC family endoribonuclease [Anaeromyxobacteraceae bacterium]
MIRSMTGFGAGRAAAGGETLEAEVRSVNHKFCEVKARLPREMGALETELVRQVKDRLARGGVEFTLRRTAARGTLAPRVDAELAAEYARAFEEVRSRLGLAGPVALADVLGAAGVVSLEERAVDLDAVRGASATALAAALDALVAMREREGEALARDLETRLGAVERLAARLAEISPRSVEDYRARLHERVAELSRGLAPDPVRLATEVALFADRTDVTEELTRLASHVAQMRGLLASGEPAGRKMDFLVQEMHREANTVGSKSQSADAAAAVVALKAEIERMREQVQNVE